jgi:hypothetical protein
MDGMDDVDEVDKRGRRGLRFVLPMRVKVRWGDEG